MERRELHRLLLVGCSRSGTTVLQRQLAAQLRLFTLPETAFFMEELRSFKTRLSAARRLGVALEPGAFGSQSGLLHQALGTIHFWRNRRRGGLTSIVGAVASRQGAANLFRDELDGRARAAADPGWLEKTPLHCLHVDLIRELLQPDGFVFVLRGGQETAASIRDRAVRFPKRYGSQHPTYRAANLWNSSMNAARLQWGRPDVFYVSYDLFASAPLDVTRKIGSRFGIPTRPASGGESGRATTTHLEEREPWKRKTTSPIKSQASKWSKVFTLEEQADLRSRLRLDVYDDLLSRIREDPRAGIV